jgi:hypothetical protein
MRNVVEVLMTERPPPQINPPPEAVAAARRAIAARQQFEFITASAALRMTISAILSTIVCWRFGYVREPMSKPWRYLDDQHRKPPSVEIPKDFPIKKLPPGVASGTEQRRYGTGDPDNPAKLSQRRLRVTVRCEKWTPKHRRWSTGGNFGTHGSDVTAVERTLPFRGQLCAWVNLKSKRSPKMSAVEAMRVTVELTEGDADNNVSINLHTVDENPDVTMHVWMIAIVSLIRGMASERGISADAMWDEVADFRARCEPDWEDVAEKMN